MAAGAKVQILLLFCITKYTPDAAGWQRFFQATGTSFRNSVSRSAPYYYAARNCHTPLPPHTRCVISTIKTSHDRLNIMKALIVGLFLVAAAFGQKEIISNSEIVLMTEAGLPAAVIIRKISTSNTRFDTSAAALVRLKSSGVADEVIVAVIDRQELIPPDGPAGSAPSFAEKQTSPNSFVSTSAPDATKREMLRSARTIALAKSSAHPSRQALEKELMKREDFQRLDLTITRYKDVADLFVEVGFVSGSWVTHRYVYRVYDRRSGAILIAGETTSWGSLAENLARHISKRLAELKV